MGEALQRELAQWYDLNKSGLPSTKTRITRIRRSRPRSILGALLYVAGFGASRDLLFRSLPVAAFGRDQSRLLLAFIDEARFGGKG